MKSKSLLLGLVLMLSVIACGNEETDQKGSGKKEQQTVQSEEQEDKADVEVVEDTDKKIETPENTQSDRVKPVEQVVTKNTKYEKPNTNVSSGAGTNASTNNTANTGSVVPSTPEHEHTWVREEKTYKFMKTYVNGCNGCGYPLFTITENGGQHLENLYYHPPYETDRYDEPCTGGGFHNESLTQGYCYFCGDSVVYRQCMWTTMGKRCATCDVLGPYEKYEFNQNHFMYLDTCSCKKNWIIIRDADKKGLILVKEYCSTCGATKE